MRTINLNGYIDEDVWYGDEITPVMLHDALYGENGATYCHLVDAEMADGM